MPKYSAQTTDEVRRGVFFGRSSDRTLGEATTDTGTAAVPSKSILARQLPVRRGLSEVEAAIYLSLSPSFFRLLVDRGVMPRPRIAGGRRIWDVEELDLAFKALPREGGGDTIFGGQGQDGSWADFE